MKIDIIENLPDAEYHGRKGTTVVSKSQLTEMLNGAASFLHACVTSSEPTPAMEIGTIVHKAVLEGIDPFGEGSKLAIKPEGLAFNTKDGKDWRKIMEDDGRIILSQDDAKAITEMILASQLTVFDPYLRTKGTSEVSIFVEDAEFGITRAIRVDRLPDSGSIAVDLKTARDSDKRGFAKAVLEYRYDMQAAYYLDTLQMAGIDKKHFVFVVLQNAKPYRPAAYVLDEYQIELGRMDYRHALKKVRAFNQGEAMPETIECPEWRIKQINERLYTEE
jgi:hypothetical protein